jgi:hypothetical protein
MGGKPASLSADCFRLRQSRSIHYFSAISTVILPIRIFCCIFSLAVKRRTNQDWLRHLRRFPPCEAIDLIPARPKADRQPCSQSEAIQGSLNTRADAFRCLSPYVQDTSVGSPLMRICPAIADMLNEISASVLARKRRKTTEEAMLLRTGGDHHHDTDYRNT